MRSVFIASAYATGGGEAVAQNVSDAMEAWHQLADHGLAGFCPHHSHFLHMRMFRERQVWLDHGLHWLAKCDCLLRLPGESEGADAEVAFAHANHIPVFHSIQDLKEFWRAQPEA